jgi:hypothetical protein
MAIHRNPKKIELAEHRTDEKSTSGNDTKVHIPKRQRNAEPTTEKSGNAKSSFHIPKKKRS